MPVRRVALLTAGGLAPCLSAAVGGLIERYTALAPDVEIVGYLDGYAGLLAGRVVTVTPQLRERAHLLYGLGGSPLGNSRVKLTNVKAAVKRGLVREGQDPLEVAADRLTQDGVDVLHTIGGDDTNTTAADLAAYLNKHGQDLTVVAEHTSTPRMLVVHEVMGRNGGWLTEETARRYHGWVTQQQFAGFGDER